MLMNKIQLGKSHDRVVVDCVELKGSKKLK